MLETNKIHNLDCLKGLKKLRDNSVDLIITDPPYNIGVDYGAGKAKDKFIMTDHIKWSMKWIQECERVLKSNGSLYIINYPENASRILFWMTRKTKLLFRNWIAWHYPTNIGCSKRNWTRSQRAILFYTKGNRFVFNLKEGEVISDVLDFNLVKNTSKEKVKGFPNQIPEKLISLLIELSSNKGDLVLDPFMGSGTTATVAKRLGRNYLGFEKNLEYIKLANRRIENGI